MLKFPGEELVTLELVHRPEDGPVDIGTGFSYIPVQVDDLAATLGQLSEARLTDSAGMWPRALVIAVRGLLRPSRPHAKGSRRERHDAALAPAPRRVRVTRGFDEIVLLVSALRTAYPPPILRRGPVEVRVRTLPRAAGSGRRR